MNKRQYKKWRQKQISDAENRYRDMFIERLIRDGRTSMIEAAKKRKLSGSMYFLRNRRIKQELAEALLTRTERINEQETV